ncbi:MAG: hypothetical protein ACYDAC_01185 [Candidatus Dormibacteria bacterium]
MSTTLGNLRRVSLWDRIDDRGAPAVLPDHPTLTEDEATKIARYLERGAVVLASPERMPDVLDSSAGPLAVRHGARTDGDWVWDELLAYYVSRYHLAPLEPFLSHVRSRNYRAPRVSRARVAEALRLLIPDDGVDTGPADDRPTGKPREDLDTVRERLRQAAEEQARIHADPTRRKPLEAKFSEPTGFDDRGEPLQRPPAST